MEGKGRRRVLGKCAVSSVVPQEMFEIVRASKSVHFLSLLSSFVKYGVGRLKTYSHPSIFIGAIAPSISPRDRCL